MKNIGKNIGRIMVAALLAMTLVAWASPSEARSGHGRSGYTKQYKHDNWNHGVHRYTCYYPGQRNYHYGYRYKSHPVRHGHYAHRGLHDSSYGTRVHIRLGF